MASQFPRAGKCDSFCPEAFDEEALACLQSAFDAAWGELLRQPNHTSTIEGELRTALGEKIMALAIAGETDPERLASRALKSFPGPRDI